MTRSVRSDDANLTSYDLLVDGSAHPEIILKRIEVDREVNKLPRAYVTCDDGNAPEADFPLSASDTFKPGAKIELKLGYHGKNQTVFTGIILGQTLRVAQGGDCDLVITCGDKAQALALNQGSHAFFDETDADAIRKTASNTGLKATIEGAKLKSPQMLQNAATDWDFILSRAEANGLVVMVDDGTLTVAPPGKGKPEVMAEFGDTIIAMDLCLDASDQLGGVTTQSWDAKTQSVKSNKATEPKLPKIGTDDGKKIADVLGGITPILAAQSPLEETVSKAWADAKLLKSRLSLFRGTIRFSGTSDLSVGGILALEGLGKRFNGSAYVSRLVHHYEAGDWQTQAHIGLDPDWLVGAQRATPPANGLRPGVSGLQIATVLKTDADPDGERRIQVTNPLNSDSSPGVWVRLASLYASKAAGCVFLPEVGDEVVIGFLDADPDAGVVLGALHSGANTAPLKPDAENTQKTVTTRSGLKLAFDDEKVVFTIETPGGHKAVFDDDAKTIVIEDTSGNKIELGDSGLSLTSPKDITIKATGKLAMSGDTGATIKSSGGDVMAEGANATLKGQIEAKVDGGASATLSGGGQAKVTGAMVMIN